jgi:uroporphyrinogen-III synthase
MKKILVTRAADQAQEFCTLLRQNGFEPVLFPVIEIAPTDDWSATDAAFRNIHSYDALVFTSPNGARYFIERMARVGSNCDELPAGFGLGKKTKETMNELGINVAPTMDTLDAKGLASEICTFMSNAGFDGVTGMKFLFPCGDKAREELPERLREHGAVVESLVVYQNRIPASINTQEVASLFAKNDIACVTFFSPSAVENFLTLFLDFKTKNGNVAIAAIGETTAEVLRSHSLSPALVSSSPDIETFAKEIAAALSK